MMRLIWISMLFLRLGAASSSGMSVENASLDNGDNDLMLMNSNNNNHRDLQQGFCCTNNFKTCYDSSWCNSMQSRCEGPCNGYWHELDTEPTCTGRWSKPSGGCTSSSACCSGLHCVKFGWGVACGIHGKDGNSIDGVDDTTTTTIATTVATTTTTTATTTLVTDDPTPSPTASPTASPTSNPTPSPTSKPTPSPTASPTASPTNAPSDSETAPPSSSPTSSPTGSPSSSPTMNPSTSPTTSPTESPVASTSEPSSSPTSSPTASPTESPIASTSDPTSSPTSSPVESPTTDPSSSPTTSPTESPVASTDNPSTGPTASPTASPSSSPVESDGVIGFMLIDANSDTQLRFLDQPSDVINLFNVGTSLTIEAITRGSVDKIDFEVDGQYYRTEGVPPYALGGDSVGDFDPVGFLTNVGETYVISARPTVGGTLGIPLVVVITIENNAGPTTNTPTIGPTFSPTTGPTTSPEEPPPTPPSDSPTTNPTLSPLNVPSILPTGPFIAAGYSERIVIPQPEVPDDLDDVPTNCPHDQGGLVDWHSLPADIFSVDVTLPENTRVVLRDTTPITVGTLTIPASSELILAPSSSAGIDLTLDGMIVKGALTAGSETCRLTLPVSLTFVGQRPNNVVTNVPAPSVKGIDVDGGTLSLHGKRFYRTWTRLAETVEPGDDILMLQDSVNWELGQEIVLVTTAMKDSREWHQNEVLTITEVFDASPTGAAIRVSPAIQHRHYAIDAYQAEVGLLSRTIKIQGSALDSEPTDPDPLNCFDNGLSGRRNGDASQPCMDKELTGYGAHMMVRNGGVGQVDGVELYRVGQTNVLGRYPMHFHLLGDCPSCYLKHSSIHRSFYRCISIHATNQATASENVAYDVSGYCYYLEDGVETDNNLTFNLAAHIHMIGPEPPSGGGQNIPIYTQSDTLTLPADVTASGFYITNVQNNLIGNTASGGWAGFAFPNLPTPVGLSKDVNIRPAAALPLTLDGNTAHSSAWWWYHTGAFYFGGALYYENGVFKYNAGRAGRNQGRETCAKDLCDAGDCFGGCSHKDRRWLTMTNSKAYLNAGVGLNSWTGRMELLGFEAHDNGLAVEALSGGFWMDELLASCRTGEEVVLPPAADLTSIKGDGFFWYDTNQAHIISNSHFRRCGYRSDEYDQYDSSPDRGCGDDAATGCASRSTVWGFLAHSDQFVPEIMQGTRNISYEKCGRRFYLRNYRGDFTTVSGRTQNWIDADGTASGLNVPTIIGSGYSEAGLWWAAGDETVHDDQGPLEFVPQFKERGLAHIHVDWDVAYNSQVGQSACGNGERPAYPCPALGYIKHKGARFAGDLGLPVTANGDIVGLAGGFGWYLEFLDGVPKEILVDRVEVDKDTPLLLQIAYPPGTVVTTTYEPAYCSYYDSYVCDWEFSSVASVDQVRQSPGNVFHMSDNGLLTIRVIMSPQTFSGKPDWYLPDWDTPGKNDNFAIDSFSREDIIIPLSSYHNQLAIRAECAGGTYCNTGIDSSPGTDLEREIHFDVCPDNMGQISFDRCCDANSCLYANGDVEFVNNI